MLGSVGEKSGRAGPGPGTPRSLLSDWTQGFCFRGVVLEGAAGRNRGAVLRRLRRHIEPMDEPQAEVLEEGRAARATAPECARRRVSRRHGARGRPVARSRASAGPCMRSDPRAGWGSVWGSLWGSAWGSMASERVENSRSARSAPVNTRSVETPTRELLAYQRRRSASSPWSPISRPPEPVWSPKGR
jgi:hypothetical protein